jgi:hypothetical protein
MFRHVSTGDPTLRMFFVALLLALSGLSQAAIPVQGSRPGSNY